MCNHYAIIMLLVLPLFYTSSIGQSLEDDIFGGSANYNECGKTVKLDKNNHFIFKNLNAKNNPGSWPWLISMGQLTSGVWTHSCGGSLVTRQHVVTAAHCPLDLVEKIKLGQIYIRAGDSHLKNDTDDAGVQNVRVASFNVHPGYRYPTRYSDIGILKLEHPVKLTSEVRTICLPDTPTLKSTENGKSYTVTGWGKDEKDRSGEDLFDTTVQVYPEEYCNLIHINDLRSKNAVPRGFTSDLFCGADARASEGVCRGDSGSPAVFFEPLKQRYVLRGVVSGGLSCGTEFHPNIYVRVTDRDILNWIQSKTTSVYEITSISGAAQHRASRMGQYIPTGDSVRGFPVFKKGEDYLYVSPDGLWVVGTNTSAAAGWIYHVDTDPTPTLPPLVGWKYWNNGSWHDDTTLNVVNIGVDRTSRVPVFYRVSSSGEAAEHQPSRMADYYPTGDIVNDFPVYRRGKQYMYVSTDGYWTVGSTTEKTSGGLYHPTTPAPSTPPVSGWQYGKAPSDGKFHTDSTLYVDAVRL